MLDLMKQYTGAQELIKTGITKSISNFLSLQSLLKQRTRLKVMFNSPEYSTNSSYTNKPQSITCIAIVEDNDFWRARMFACNLAKEARDTVPPGKYTIFYSIRCL
ncbi:hypothetical protein CFP56_030443 [Quercus suber]|uniref:Uncharacterized protein n=1 Tax=Quercus suber TaxID=58331 RepID=A0AAW0JNE1_QUESU